MRQRSWWLALVVVGVLATAIVTVRRDRAASETQISARPAAIGTIRDVMRGIVDPSADVLFDSVATRITAAGVDEHKPETEEDWSIVQRNALMLIEAANLLVLEDRLVANPEAADELTADGPELTPRQIAERIAANRALWNRQALGLQEVAMKAWKAPNAKDAQALFYAGDDIDKACESCHGQYWYRARPAASDK